MSQQQRTLEDNLLLCQLVYNLGAINWETIAYKLREWSKERGKIINMNPDVSRTRRKSLYMQLICVLKGVPINMAAPFEAARSGSV